MSTAVAAPVSAPPFADGLRQDAVRERVALFGLSVPALVLIGVFLVLPTIWLFVLSFVAEDGWSLVHYQRMLDEPAYASVFATTFRVSLIVTLLVVLLGYPTAYALSLMPPFWAAVGQACILVPFWTSLLVRTYAWLVLLQRRGTINTALQDIGLIDQPLRFANNEMAVVIGMVHIMLPFFILPLFASLKTIDPNLLRASASLGASPARAFRDVTLPLSLPGFAAGVILTFVLCLGFYVTPQVLGGGRVTMISMKIEQNISIYFDWGAASSLGVVLLVLVAGALGVAALIGRRYGGRAPV